MDVIGVMFSVSVDALRMPRFLANTAIYVSKLDQKLARSECHYCTVLEINPRGIPQVSYEPIIGVDRLNVLSMQECSSADWNPEDTSTWSESAHYTKGMSQQYLIMIAISKH